MKKWKVKLCFSKLFIWSLWETWSQITFLNLNFRFSILFWTRELIPFYPDFTWISEVKICPNSGIPRTLLCLFSFECGGESSEITSWHLGEHDVTLALPAESGKASTCSVTKLLRQSFGFGPEQLQLTIKEFLLASKIPRKINVMKYKHIGYTGFLKLHLPHLR